jgi:hypothetical protein
MMRQALPRLWVLAGTFLAACSQTPDQAGVRPLANAVPLESGRAAVAPKVPVAASTSVPIGSAAPALAPSPEGAEFIGPARTLFRVAACAESGEVPARLDEGTVQRHCARLRLAYKRYRDGYRARAAAFLGTIRPEDLPRRVVYPFGGGDLVTALTVFPDADEITTLSLEPPGDVRRIDTIPPERLRGALRVTGYGALKLLGITYSNTVNLGKDGHASLPGELVLHLAALVVHGYEPTSLRYFQVRLDGSLHYLSAEEVEAEGEREHADLEGANAPFANVEMHFKKPGAPGGERILRHMAQDLSDHELGKTPGLRAYLEAEGPVAVMTKAASHLLWADEFSIIRGYILDHAVWMISDSTGIPPRFASAAGFVQETYGVFDAPARYGPIEQLDATAFRLLFAEQPRRPLPMQFGYLDRHHHGHLIVMHKSTGPSAATFH